MKPIQGYDLVNEAGDFKQLPAGIYGVVITKVVDVPDKEYLEVYCDIAKGEYKDYFKQLTDVGLTDVSKTCRSYKSTALSFFKAFITAVEKSNPGYSWDWDEQKLVGKKVIALFGEEEYLDKDYNVKTVVKVREFRSLEAFQSGKLTIPEKIKLSPEDQAKLANRPTTPVTDSGVPIPETIDPNELPF